MQAGRNLVGCLVQADLAEVALGESWLGGQLLGVLEALHARHLVLVVPLACLKDLLAAVQASHRESVALVVL